MTLHAPAYLQGNNYPAENDRHAVFAADGVGVVDGLVVTQRATGANMTVDVSAGHAVLPVVSGKTGVWSDAVLSVPIAAAPPANARIDVVYALVSGSGWAVSVQVGTVAVSPVAPAVPTYAVPLAQVTVATGTSAITNAMITNVSSRSMPLASTEWPVVEAVTMTPTGVLNGSIATWGSLVFPAPNRPVKVVATATIQISITDNSGVDGFALLRCSHSSTYIDGLEWMASPTVIGFGGSGLVLSVTEMFSFTPTGAVTIAARVRNTADTLTFDAGRIVATMYPR